MKLAFLLLFSAFAVSAIGQFEDLNKRKPWEDFKKKYNYKKGPDIKILPKTLEGPEPGQPADGVYKLPLKGRFVGSTPNGDNVYAMQPDNMPCLVPGSSFSSSMPVKGVQKKNRLNKQEQPGSDN